MLKIHPIKGRTYETKAQAQFDLDNDRTFSIGPKGEGMYIDRLQLIKLGYGFVDMPKEGVQYGWELRVNRW